MIKTAQINKPAPYRIFKNRKKPNIAIAPKNKLLFIEKGDRINNRMQIRKKP